MRGKFLIHRTVAPRLSELLDEVYDLLKVVNSDAHNFTILIRDNGEEIQTRVFPMDSKDMEELFDTINHSIKYVAHTDENSNFIRGEEKGE